jgi:hypothetical protein
MRRPESCIAWSPKPPFDRATEGGIYSGQKEQKLMAINITMFSDFI